MSASNPKNMLLPKPNEAQQRVIDRIAVQRERLDERRAQRARQKAVLHAQAHPSDSMSLVLRAAALAKQYPAAVAALAALALVTAGPKRASRWIGVALPLLMRFRGR